MIVSGKYGHEYPALVEERDSYLLIRYTSLGWNNSHREHSVIIPRFIKRNKKMFEALGLLQAEMGKTQNGCIVFANSEHKLVNKVLLWFEKEWEIPTSIWKWYLRINLVEPEDSDFKQKLTSELKEYWIQHANIDPLKHYPTILSFVKETENKTPKNYGTIMIEYKMNLLSQIVKKFVKDMSYAMPTCEKEEIQAFMRGIIAGEGCVEIHKEDMRYRVFITAVNSHEKQIYSDCLTKLGIESHNYPGKDLVISRRENNLQLLEQQLMTLSPSKYNKFLSMMKLYGNIRNDTRYFQPKGVNRPANKTSQEKIDAVLTMSKEGKGSKEIAEQLGLGILVVQRLRRKYHLGRSFTMSSPEMVEKIRALCERHPFFHVYEVAAILRVHASRVQRIRKKYGLKIVKAGPKKVPQYILDEVTGEEGFKKVMEMEAVAHRKL